MAQALNRREMNSERNLQYGPRTRLGRGMYMYTQGQIFEINTTGD